jgi:Ricin-type beta-trefoil lectin domain-like
MPGQRHSAGPRSRGSRLARLAGISVVVLLAAGGVAAYLVELHPVALPRAAPLPTHVLSRQTVGLIAQGTQQASSQDQLLQLLGPQGTLQFSPVSQAEEQAGSPQWTANLMAGNSYIFIFVPTGDCLAAAGSKTQPRLALQHCDLKAAQRWRRTQAAVASEGHDYFQYANLADGACLTQTGEQSGQDFGAALAACSPSAPAGQLIAFWWSSV